jgi:hypothetical protein
VIDAESGFSNINLTRAANLVTLGFTLNLTFRPVGFRVSLFRLDFVLVLEENVL